MTSEAKKDEKIYAHFSAQRKLEIREQGSGKLLAVVAPDFSESRWDNERSWPDLAKAIQEAIRKANQ